MTKGRILILGAGGHGKVAGDCAFASGNWSDVLFFDDRWPELQKCGTWSVIGTTEAVLKMYRPGDQAFVAVGNSDTRLRLLQQLKAERVSLATIIHPRAIVSTGATIEPGTVIVAGAVVNIDVRVGPGCIINTSASVDHDCVLGEGVHICPGAHLAGNVWVGKRAWIGIGSTVCQSIRIGDMATVGAGAVVLEDVPDFETVAGVPARVLPKKRA